MLSLWRNCISCNMIFWSLLILILKNKTMFSLGKKYMKNWFIYISEQNVMRIKKGVWRALHFQSLICLIVMIPGGWFYDTFIFVINILSKGSSLVRNLCGRWYLTTQWKRIYIRLENNYRNEMYTVRGSGQVYQISKF